MVLDWMYKNPRLCRHTNIAEITDNILSSGYQSTQSAISQSLRKMMDHNIINRFGGVRKADFSINLLHESIPQYILEQTPEGVNGHRIKLISGLKDNQSLDADGCIVTHNNEILQPETEPEEQEEPAEKVPVDQAVEITAPVKVTKDGINLNFTINLNIKLN